jgi:hypothetical protein
VRTRARNPFTTVTTAGLLLPVDLLTRIVDGDPNLPGLLPKDYHLRSSERLNEAASRAWNECLAAWKSFRKKFAALPASDAGTTLTRDEWLLPLFRELGYGRLQPKRAVQIESREYPISHGWENHVPIHLLSARYSIDRRTQGAAGAATRAPYSLLQELLNRSSQHRWGFVTNGLKLYLLHDNAALARAANVEFDLEAMMDGELYADFMLLFLLCHQSRVEIQPTPIAKVTLDRKTGKAKKAKATSQKKLVTDDDAEAADGDDSVDAEDEKTRLGPENCWLERWANQADQQGTRARDKLRDGVEAAIKSLGAGFLTTKGNQELRERMRTGELSTQDYYRQLLRVVYRLLMLLVAEEKKTENGANLFHPPGTPLEVCDRYARFYSVSRIRTLAYERRGTAHTDLYESLKVLFHKLREGYAQLGIPGMGSFLFSDDSTPDLDDAFLANQDLLDAFRNLCYTEDTSGRGGSIRRPVDFGSLGSDELGSVYESLLELHPKIDTDEGPFTLGTASGNERKTTGSYYTPTSLINCLLDSALDPVVHAAIDVPDRAEAERKLLNLKVCDPACGSGHFLIAAAERMAMHLARLRTGDDEPNTLDVQHAKRDIIGRCIYGVDINPMAVELCKVALWMEAMEPGKPFSYLDHHIQCGNSLLGTTPALLAKGIPDDAFTPIEGDDRKFCSALKADNKKQRKDVERGQTGFAFDNPFPAAHLGERMMSINEAPDDSLEQIERKRALSKQFFSSPVWQDAYFWANYWCAAFVWKKDGSELAKQCPTERDFRRIERDGRKALLPHVSTEVDRLSEQYQFLHWHLAYPDVFRVPEKDEVPENEQTGWNGGFDVVLGNPPWDKMELMEKEWFSEKRPDIANAQTGAKRKRLIEALAAEDPETFRAFQAATRQADCERHHIQNAGRFPLCGSGRINTYATFAETSRLLISGDGRIGFILPSGVGTDDSTKSLFQEFVSTNTLVSFHDFENKLLIFPTVAPVMRFCLLTLSGRNRPVPTGSDFVFFAQGVLDLLDKERHFTLTAKEITLINPNTRTCPIFKNHGEAEVSKRIYRSCPVLLTHTPSLNPWGVMLRQGLFNMTSDSEHFVSKATLETMGHVLDGNHFGLGSLIHLPMYEAKLVQQYTHRHGTFRGLEGDAIFNTKAATKSPSAIELDAPSLFTIPRYWVSKELVEEAVPKFWNRGWFIVFRDIIQAMTNARCAVFAVISRVAVSNNLPILFPDSSLVSSSPLLLANLNSFVFDFAARQKIGGTHLNFYIVEQLPVLPPDTFSQPCRWTIADSPVTTGLLSTWLRPRVLELTNTAWDLEPFAQDCGYDGPPFRWDEERRFQLRAELDAAFFHLYLPSNAQGDWLPANESPEDLARVKESFPQPRDAVSYIMDTFPIVRRKDIAKHGTYRTKDTILEIYDAMQTAIRTGIPYQTPLIPSPGPPTDSNGQFIPFAQWTSNLNTSHIHPPREMPQKKLQVVVVDPVFPQTDLERVLCACLLDFVTSQPSLKEDEFVDLMILAMQPANCRLLLTGDDRDRFDQSLKAVLPELISDSDGKPPWRLLLSTLQANQSIQVSGHAVLSGDKLKVVRRSLPQVDDQFLSLVAKAGERLRELQETAAPDSASAAVVEASRNRRTAAMAGAPGK